MIEPGIRRDTLVKVAKMYYLEKLSQEQIASKLYLSRSSISHMLKVCVDEEIVEFKINDATTGDIELGDRLKHLYLLKEAVVVSSESDETDNRIGVARAAGRHLSSLLHSNMTLGIGWGTSLFHTIKYLSNTMSISGVEVVQLMGGIGSANLYTDAHQLIHSMTEMLHGKGLPLLAPAVVHEKALREMLLHDPSIRRVFEAYNHIEIAVLGLGTCRKDREAMYRSGSLSEEEWEYAQLNGGVGDLCGYRLDINGIPCLPEINERVVAIGLEQLREVPVRIGLADSHEVPSAVAAVRGGYINTLIVDEKTALAMLRYGLERQD